MCFMTIYKEILSLMQYMELKLQWSRYTQKNKAWDIVLHYLCFNSLWDHPNSLFYYYWIVANVLLYAITLEHDTV